VVPDGLSAPPSPSNSNVEEFIEENAAEETQPAGTEAEGVRLASEPAVTSQNPQLGSLARLLASRLDSESEEYRKLYNRLTTEILCHFCDILEVDRSSVIPGSYASKRRILDLLEEKVGTHQSLFDPRWLTRLLNSCKKMIFGTDS
jgi:hypothetical protein